MIKNNATVQDLSKPLGLSIKNNYSQFSSVFFVDTSYRFTNTSDFKSESVWLQGIKDGYIIPLHDIITVDYQGEPDVYETSLQDFTYDSRPGKDSFILKFDFDITYHKKLKSYDNQNYNVIFADINNNLYAWLNGSLIDGFETDIIHTEKMVWGSTPEHAWSKMRIDLTDSSQLNEYGVIEKVTWDISSLAYLTVDIQNISSQTVNELRFQVVDSIYGCAINGLDENDITIIDDDSGTITVSSIVNTIDGYYTIASGDEFNKGTITIDTSRYYGTQTYFVRGSEWAQLSSPVSVTLSGVNMYNSLIGYIAGSSDEILVTADGDTWTQATVNTTGVNYNSVFADPVDSDHVFACGGNGKMAKSSDGATFNNVNTGITESLYDIIILETSPVRIICCGQDGTFIFSTNDGASWATYATGTGTESLYSLSYSSVSTYYACGANGTIIKSTTSGVSWSSLTSGLAGNLNSIYFLVGTTIGWCGGNDGVLIKTTNGNTWSTVYTFTGKAISSVFFPNSLVGFVATTTGEVYITSDGGSTFDETDISPTGYIRALYFLDSNNGYAIGTNGEIFKY